MKNIAEGEEIGNEEEEPQDRALGHTCSDCSCYNMTLTALLYFYFHNRPSHLFFSRCYSDSR